MIKAKVEIIGFEEGTEWDDIVDEIDGNLTIPSLSDLEGEDYNFYFCKAVDSYVRLTKDLNIKIITFSYVNDNEEAEYYEVSMLNGLEEIIGWDTEDYMEYQYLFKNKDEGEYKMNMYWNSEDIDEIYVEYSSMEKL